MIAVVGEFADVIDSAAISISAEIKERRCLRLLRFPLPTILCFFRNYLKRTHLRQRIVIILWTRLVRDSDRVRDLPCYWATLAKSIFPSNAFPYGLLAYRTESIFLLGGDGGQGAIYFS